MLVPFACALGQTIATGDGASSDDLTKRLEWLRAQVGKAADGKATPAPVAPKKFSDSRTLSLRPGELRPTDPAVAKSSPAPVQKTIAQAPSTTPVPAREKSAEPKAKKTSVADRSTSAAPAPVAQGPKSSKAEANSKVAQAPATTPAPGKEKSTDSKAKKTSVAENSPSTTPAPAAQGPKSSKADGSSKVAQTTTPPPAPSKEKASDSKSKKTTAIAAATATPAPAPAAPKSSKADATAKIARAAATPTPAPATPAPSRVASTKPTPTPAHRGETLSLDTRFTDLRSSSLSQPSRSISAIGSSSAAYARMAGSPSMPMANYGSSSVAGRYPWKTGIVTTVFWIGEPVSGRNFTPNIASSWDPIWTRNYGGYDNPNPEARRNFIPINFIPRQNPFYVALPYNDVTHGTTKPEARVIIPWFREAFRREGQSVCRDRWVAVRSRAGRVAYAQWSDCGPFRTDHWQYVFGMERPKPNLNQGAGLDVSPAMRDYLGLSSTDVTDWKFVDAKDVPNGPWALYGDNNTCPQRGRFVRAGQGLSEVAARTR